MARTELEMWKDDRTLFSGAVVEVDASFDHAHGRQQDVELEVEDDSFHVVVWIDNMDYDVTKALREQPSVWNNFKDQFLVFAYEQRAKESGAA